MFCLPLTSQFKSNSASSLMILHFVLVVMLQPKFYLSIVDSYNQELPEVLGENKTLYSWWK